MWIFEFFFLRGNIYTGFRSTTAFGSVSLLNELFNTEKIHSEEHNLYYLTPKFDSGISPKVNILERLEMEPFYSESAIKDFGYYSTGSLRTLLKNDNNF